MDATPSPELLIILAALEARRKQKGFKWCCKHGVGAQRTILAGALNVVSIAAQAPDAVALVKARQDAADVLAATCRACGGCKMARE